MPVTKFNNLHNGRFIDGSQLPGELGRSDCQAGWHAVFQQLRESMDESARVLDVGSGLCLIRQRVPQVVCQDVAPDLPVDLTLPIADLPGDYADWVTTFDVIEHVLDDVGFAQQLQRLARRGVMLTTPNATVSRCEGRHHCREYLPEELTELLLPIFPEATYSCRYYAGSSSGDVWYAAAVSHTHDQPHHGFAFLRREYGLL